MADTHNDMSGWISGNAIQAGTVHIGASMRAALAGLPPVPSGFTGREDMLAVLRDALSESSPTPVWVVAGLAGVGKTTVVLKAAHEAAPDFPGGVLFVDLQGYADHPMEPLGALSTFLHALGEQSPASQAACEQVYRSRLADAERTLIVLDNASSRDQVRPLLPGSPRHKVLITSRHTLADLDAQLVDLNVLTLEEGIAQLAKALKDERVAAEPEAAQELVDLCGRLPLALGIVAALLRSDPELLLSEFADDLRDEDERLNDLSYGPNTTVRRAFDLSYQRLSEDEARLFRLMSLVSGDISTGMAAGVANVSPRQAHRLLAGLRRAHMAETSSPKGWYRLHDLVRLYSTERRKIEVDQQELQAAAFRLYIAIKRELVDTGLMSEAEFESGMRHPGGPGAAFDQ